MWVAVTVLCAFVFCTAVFFASTEGSFAADEIGDESNESTLIEKHGPAQILAENLIRVREQELLLLAEQSGKVPPTFSASGLAQFALLQWLRA